jgi:hypothetical protein
VPSPCRDRRAGPASLPSIARLSYLDVILRLFRDGSVVRVEDVRLALGRAVEEPNRFAITATAEAPNGLYVTAVVSAALHRPTRFSFPTRRADSPGGCNAPGRAACGCVLCTERHGGRSARAREVAEDQGVGPGQPRSIEAPNRAVEFFERARAMGIWAAPARRRDRSQREATVTSISSQIGSVAVTSLVWKRPRPFPGEAPLEPRGAHSAQLRKKT